MFCSTALPHVRRRRTSGLRVSLLLVLAATAVACGTSTEAGDANIHLDITQTGAQPDPDGFTLLVDGVGRAAPAGRSVVGGVSSGWHVFRLDGLAYNCEPVGLDSAEAEVGGSGTAVHTLRFQVHCPRAVTGRLVHVEWPTAAGGRLMSLTLATGERAVLVRPSVAGASIDAVSMSPNGTRAAYVERTNGTPRLGVYDVEAGTGGALVHVPTAAHSPSWSRSGRAFAYQGVNGNAVWVHDWASHANERVVADAQTSSAAPALSPDGRRVAYVQGSTITTVARDGSDARPLTMGSSPDWSPDGSRLAYTNGGVWVMNADGSDQRRLWEGTAYEPAWSHDGQRIAFTTPAGLKMRVAVMNADGSGLAFLTPETEMSLTPSWTP